MFYTLQTIIRSLKGRTGKSWVFESRISKFRRPGWCKAPIKRSSKPFLHFPMLLTQFFDDQNSWSRSSGTTAGCAAFLLADCMAFFPQHAMRVRCVCKVCGSVQSQRVHSPGLAHFAKRPNRVDREGFRNHNGTRRALGMLQGITHGGTHTAEVCKRLAWAPAPDEF